MCHTSGEKLRPSKRESGNLGPLLLLFGNAGFAADTGDARDDPRFGASRDKWFRWLHARWRNLKMKTIVTAVLAAAVLVAPASAGNILVNPGFESGVLDPWYQKVDYGGPENWNVTTADFHSGMYSATDRGNKLLAQDFDPVSVEDILEASLWIRNVDASINAIYFEYSDLSTQEELLFHSNSNWNYWDMTAYLQPGKELISFGIYGVSGGETERTYVDDWVLDVIPGPGGLVVLSVGLLCARRRRGG
jgi:hypothetical protein